MEDYIFEYSKECESPQYPYTKLNLTVSSNKIRFLIFRIIFNNKMVGSIQMNVCEYAHS